MAVITTQEKLALMAYNHRPHVPNPIPSGDGVLTQGDLQQLLHGYPSILWTVVIGILYFGALNDRQWQYWRDV